MSERPLTPTEQIVAEQWSRRLGGVTVRPEDNFTDLGGSSLQAVEFLQALRDGWSLELSAADLVEHATLREFSTHVDRLRSESFRRGGTTVRLQQGEPGVPPLFCFTGGGASSLTFVRLAAALDPAVPVYSLQWRGMESRGLADWTVRAAARRQLREIRRLSPAGPYRLAAHSSGGLVAIECARSLLAAGEQVAPLTLLDTAVPPNVVSRYRELHGADPSFDPDENIRVSAVVPSRTERLAMHVRVAVGGLVQFDLPTHQVVMWEQGKRVLHRHKLYPFSHPVVVALTSEYGAQRKLWPLVAGPDVRIVDIGERHNDVVRDGLVAVECADLVAECTLDAGSQAYPR